MSSETGFLETNGARIYYEVDGSGDAVVLIHAGIANLRQWDDLVPALADAYRVVRYDTRGFGRTETEDVEFSNRADIAALLDHLGEESAHIVGMSRSGQIALDFALEFRERVRSITVACGGVSGFQAEGDEDASVWEQVEQWEQAKDWASLSKFEADFWVNGPGQPSGRADPRIHEQVHEWILTNYRANKAEGKPIRLDPPAAKRLHELRAPLLVMLGTLEEVSTAAAMRHLVENVPGARLEMFDNAAHMLNLEQPERFNRVLRGFLDANRLANVA